MKKLLPPPFSIGTMVEYTGTREIYADSEGKIPLLKKGLQFIIQQLRPPERGGKVFVMDDERIVTPDKNGASVYFNFRGEGRLIHAQDKKEWKIV